MEEKKLPMDTSMPAKSADESPPPTSAENPERESVLTLPFESEKQAEITTPLIIDQPPLSGNMEVHHHGHVHEKKKWKEYLFQFLMLFLAITLGFFVENRREHYIEGLRAKEYAHTLLQDIIKDTLELDETITYYRENIAIVETLLELDRTSETGTVPSGALYHYGKVALTAFRMSFNDATLQQLKNSGNLRYFRNLKLKENISAYDNATRTFSLRQDLELTFVPAINEYSKLFDHVIQNTLFKNKDNPVFIDSFVKANPPLLINDPVVTKQFLGFCSSRWKNWMGRISRNILPVLIMARELIAMLKTEYHFK